MGMRRAIGRGSAALAVGLVWACGPSADPAHERAALLDADRAFARAAADDRLDGWVRYFAGEGAMIQPGRIVGKASG